MTVMTKLQLRYYAKLIHETYLRNSSAFFKQNQGNRHINLLCTQETLAEELPYRHHIGQLSQGNVNIWCLHDNPPWLS